MTKKWNNEDEGWGTLCQLQFYITKIITPFCYYSRHNSHALCFYNDNNNNINSSLEETRKQCQIFQALSNWKFEKKIAKGTTNVYNRIILAKSSYFSSIWVTRLFFLEVVFVGVNSAVVVCVCVIDMCGRYIFTTTCLSMSVPLHSGVFIWTLSNIDMCKHRTSKSTHSVINCHTHWSR